MFFWEKEKAFLFHFHSDKPFWTAFQTSDSRRGKCLTPSLEADSSDPQRSLIQTLDLTEPSSHIQPLDPGPTNTPGDLRAFPQHAWAKIICVPITLWPPLALSATAGVGGHRQRRKRCLISRSTMGMTTLPSSDRQQMDRLGVCPVWSPIPLVPPRHSMQRFFQSVGDLFT